MSVKKKLILAVDDSLTMRKLTETTLRQSGHELLLASTGEEGFRLALERRPDLVLLDYILPDMRGVEFCQKLQEAEVDHQIPVLLISGHGNAIRELYQDFPNVVDYLTKPFAANVLQAVVSNILLKIEKGAPAADPAANGAPPSASVGGATTAAPAGAPTGVPAGPRSTVHEMRQRVFQRLVARLHAPLSAVPSLEEARGGQAPSSYYLTRLLPLELIDELAEDLLTLGSEQGRSPEEEPIRCPARFASERHMLTFLCAERATGCLTMKLRDETVSAFLDRGQIIAVTSNNPRSYCAGSPYPFAQVPRPLIAQAMQAQREQAVPFFITLEEGGFQSSGMSLRPLLRDAGHRALGRVGEEKNAYLAFSAMSQLPSWVQDHRMEFTLGQLLLESYRRVSDWQQISAYVPSLDYHVALTEHGQEQLSRLHFSPLESDLLGRIDGVLTVQHLCDQTGQPVFEVCRALFCLIRLDLCFLASMPLPVAAEEPAFAEAAVA